MPKYLLLKHYRGGPEPHHPFPPMDQWAPEDVEAHMAFLRHVSELLEENGEYVDAQALTPERTWVRYGGPDAAPVTTDGPHPETSDLVAGWYMIDVESHERALEIAAYVSSEPGPGGEPMYEWIDVREVMSGAPRTTDPAWSTSRCGGWTRAPLRALVPRVLAGLVRRGEDFDAAEDALQEALLEALRVWPEHPPRDPRAWLTHGRDAAARRRPPQRGRAAAPRGDELRGAAAAGRHGGGRRHAVPALLLLPPGPRARLPGGIDPARGRRPHHARDRRRLLRPGGDDGAADQPGQADPAGTPPGPARRPRRRAARALPRLHGRAYRPAYGPPAQDLAGEAIRLARQLTLATPEPEARGLLALMLLNHARLPARLDPEGRIVTLDRQDRGLWDRCEIAEGVRVLQSALAVQTDDRRPGRYQVEAAIAALHDDAASTEETDWPQILSWYDDLVALSDDPVRQDPAAVLGRAVAIGHVHGAGRRAGRDRPAARGDRRPAPVARRARASARARRRPARRRPGVRRGRPPGHERRRARPPGPPGRPRASRRPMWERSSQRACSIGSSLPSSA